MKEVTKTVKAKFNSPLGAGQKARILKDNRPIGISKGDHAGVVQRTQRAGGNPRGRGGKSKKFVRQSHPKPLNRGSKSLLPTEKKKKLKFDHGKVVYRLLTLGGKLHIDHDSIPLKDQNKVLSLITFLRALANSMQENPIISYLEAIEERISQGHIAVNKVVLKATKEGEHGSFAPKNGIVTMSVGTINDSGVLELRNPLGFLQTLVHEFTHVMDISLRKRTILSTDHSQDPNEYDRLIENHPDVSKKLKVMLSQFFYHGYSGYSHGAKWSEVIAHFSELGVLGPSGQLITGIKFQWLHYFSEKVNAQGTNEDEAKAYADHKIDSFMGEIIHGIILPFVRSAESKPVRDFFYGIILRMPSASQIANMALDG